MNKRVVRRLLETLFRRWWLYLLPVLLFLAVGVQQAAGADSGYRSVGVVDVSTGTLLSELTSIRGDLYGYETPAVVTSRSINSLLRTDQFIESVAVRAGIGDALRAGVIMPLQLRSAISAGADGDTLLQVSATTDDPELSARLADATIASFISYVTAGDISESRAAGDFFQSQIDLYQQSLTEAQQVLADYARNNPGPALERRPLEEQIVIQDLTSKVDAADARVDDARQKAEEARLATEQATTDVIQRLRIVDVPQIPAGPVPRLKNMVLTLGIFTMVGLVLTVSALVTGSLVDRSLRSAEDVDHLFGLPVLASIPEAITP